MINPVALFPGYPTRCLALMLALAASCPVGAAADTIRAWQVRGDVGADLNAAEGWAANVNDTARVRVDEVFRIRFEVESPEPGEPRYRLEMRRNGSDWRPVQALDHPYPEEIASPVTSIVKASTFDHGEPTEDRIEVSQRAFAGGSGISLRPSPLLRPIDAGQTEWEWPLVIRYFSDGAIRVDEGDVFEYRMTTWSGTPLPGDHARVVVEIPDGHLGGTYVETPDRIGPFEADNGDLYFIQEPAETGNVFMVVKSQDGGRSWFEADGGNRPETADLEAVAAVLLDGTLHMMHQADAVWYHQFQVSTHTKRPDRWGVRDQPIHGELDPPTQVASLSATSDGRLVAVYGAEHALYYRIRESDGTWGETFEVLGLPGRSLSGPVSTAGDQGAVHLAYVDDQGAGWYRTIRSDGSLSAAERFTTNLGRSESERVALLPLNRLDSGELSILYRIDTGTVLERRRTVDGIWSEPVPATDTVVASGPVDSDQVTADAIAVGNDLHLLFIDRDTGSLWHAARPDGSTHWTSPTRIIDGIKGQWVRGGLLQHGPGGPRYGYVVDTGSNGGSGRNRFGVVHLTLAPDGAH